MESMHHNGCLTWIFVCGSAELDMLSSLICFTLFLGFDCEKASGLLESIFTKSLWQSKNFPQSS